VAKSPPFLPKHDDVRVLPSLLQIPRDSVSEYPATAFGAVEGVVCFGFDSGFKMVLGPLWTPSR
jgi:hypothetical protein